MEKSLTANRLGPLACLTGITALVSFAMFNVNQSWSDLFPGSPFASLLLGVAAMAMGIISQRRSLADPRFYRVCAWLGIVFGSVMILLWIGTALLILSVMFGEPL